MENIPELIAGNMLIAALVAGLVGLIVGILIGGFVRARRNPDDRG
jgi:hypothetical protein